MGLSRSMRPNIRLIRSAKRVSMPPRPRWRRVGSSHGIVDAGSATGAAVSSKASDGSGVRTLAAMPGGCSTRGVSLGLMRLRPRAVARLRAPGVASRSAGALRSTTSCHGMGAATAVGATTIRPISKCCATDAMLLRRRGNCGNGGHCERVADDPGSGRPAARWATHGRAGDIGRQPALSAHPPPPVRPSRRARAVRTSRRTSGPGGVDSPGGATPEAGNGRDHEAQGRVVRRPGQPRPDTEWKARPPIV